MNSKERMLAALAGEKPDRLPVTTHHIMPYFLNKYMDGISNDQFFDQIGLDPIRWLNPLVNQNPGGFNSPRIEGDYLALDCYESEDCRIEVVQLDDSEYFTRRINYVTPKGILSIVFQSNEFTSWASEHLIKEKSDIDLIEEFFPTVKCDVEEVNKVAEEYGDRGLIRGHITPFTSNGQPGCWQDACYQVGVEKLLMLTFDDPAWIHRLLKILLEKKMVHVKSLAGARYDILEMGGGDASTTVISPKLFDEFVAPYEVPLIDAAHEAGQKVAYHTCGGMMPILENLADMGVDALETFTPTDMGADVDLGEAKKRIGDKVCMIGGFDQLHHFTQCSPEETRAAVRRAFEEAGENGGFILSPSDHFFDAEVELLKAFADEARRCVY